MERLDRRAIGHVARPGAVVFSPDATKLATFDPDTNNINVYELRIEDLVALAKSHLTRTWTLDECRTFLHTGSCPVQ